MEKPQSTTEKIEPTESSEHKSTQVKESPPMEKQQHLQYEQPNVYKPYSMIPTHIKQLIVKMYEPQVPYVDPTVYIYHTPIQSPIQDHPGSVKSESVHSEQKADRRQESSAHETDNYEQQSKNKATYQQNTEQEAASHQESVRQKTDEDQSNQEKGSQQNSEYNNASHKSTEQSSNEKQPQESHIEYKEKNQESESKSQHESASQEATPSTPTEYQNSQEYTMPSLLQQLLNLQAQIPYYVIANKIYYQPKKLFVPKPIAEDDNGLYTYRSKVYYLRNDGFDQENTQGKSGNENQRH